jgi:hypothetical protein
MPDNVIIVESPTEVVVEAASPQGVPKFSPWENFRPGQPYRFYPADSGTAASFTSVAGLSMFVPFVVPRSCFLASAQVRCQTGQVGASCLSGLLLDNASSLPGSLVSSFAPVDFSSSGTKFFNAGPLPLSANVLYYFGFLFNVSGVVLRARTGISSLLPLFSPDMVGLNAQGFVRQGLPASVIDGYPAVTAFPQVVPSVSFAFDV